MGALAPPHDTREGYIGDGVLGCRAGPVIRFENLAHEMAHALEITAAGRPEGLSKNSWGMVVRQVVIMGQICDEPLTLQATERECRVAGIQKRILEMVGAPGQRFFTRRSAKLFHDWLPDYFHGGKTITDKMATRCALIETSHQAWPAERVLEQWAQVAPRLIAIAAQSKSRSPLKRAPARRLNAAQVSQPEFSGAVLD